MRRIVIWSGGMDSSALLHYLATKHSPNEDIYAVSVDAHPQLHKGMLCKQREARTNYLKWARKQHLNIKDYTIKVETDLEARHKEGETGLVQPMLWISHILPYINDGMKIWAGSVENDDDMKDVIVDLSDPNGKKKIRNAIKKRR